MRGLLLPLVTLFAATALSAVAQPVVVGSPDVLPLALDDSFRVVKVFSQTIDPQLNAKAKIDSLKAEIDRRYFGAINEFEKRQREGNYYTVQWQAPKVSGGSDVTVRLEYRQKKLGAHVLAFDAHYPSASGTISTEFSVLGDDYYQDGAVVAWRVLLIQKGRIVGVQQSFLW
ncbi:MAG: hypothetical protein WCO60_04355 [Verrucomicrobiota bacterium]